MVRSCLVVPGSDDVRMEETPVFFNSFGRVSVTKNRLPHWEQDGCSYFITFRLADSLPKHLLENWKSERARWLERNPEPWSPEVEKEYHSRFSGARERWLDAMHGDCLLRDAKAREPLADRLKQDLSSIWSFVVMPNHVHVLVSLEPDVTLSEWIQSTKGGSSVAINRALGRKGSLWARDYFDRLIRDASHFRNCARYIRNNPAKAKLGPDGFLLDESDYVNYLLGSGRCAGGGS